MAYSKQTWHDLPDQTTPINAERLNHMEDGIYNNSLKIVDDYSEAQDRGYSANYINGLATKNSAKSSNFITNELVINGNDQVITSVELVCTGKPILVSFSVPAHGAGNGSPQFKVWVDSTQKAMYIDSVGTARHITSYTTILTDITVGTHTIKLYGSKGNDTSLTIDTFTSYNLMAVEL